MANKSQKTPEQKLYEEKVRSKMPSSRVFSQCVRAFAVGGLICCIGQLISDLGKLCFGLDESSLAALTAITLIFIAALLTGIGVFDKIGRFAGAGSIVPITGFANSIVAPAMEFKKEGMVEGIGSKTFSIAGPVLIYGIGTSVVVGLLYFIFCGMA